MGKMVVAVIAGFALWSVLWVGSNQALTRLSPAMFKPSEGQMPPIIALVALLVLSIICSVLSGGLAGILYRTSMTPVWILAVLLLVTGVLVERGIWNLLPLWYHATFLALLIPVTAFGGFLAQLRG